MRRIPLLLSGLFFSGILVAQVVTLKPLATNPQVEAHFQKVRNMERDELKRLADWDPEESFAHKIGCPILETGVTYVVSGDSVLLDFQTPFASIFDSVYFSRNFGSFKLGREAATYYSNAGIQVGRDTLKISRCNTDNLCDTITFAIVVKRPNQSQVEPAIPWQPREMGIYCINQVNLPGDLACNFFESCPDPYLGEGQQLTYFTDYSAPDLCFVYRASYFPGTDTVCVVYCDEFTICDTVKVPFEIIGDTLKLPFFDDFAYSGPYPSPTRWLDEAAFVNPTMGGNPPSVGVATLDGLGPNGKPYGGGYGVADFLTSKPIDLSLSSPGNRVVLSFYAQPRGKGFVPLENDSLVVQFKNKDGIWKNAGAFTGFSNFIPLDSVPPFVYHAFGISQLEFFHKGFQFRFKNYNRREGAYSNWHIDFVWLDQNRDGSRAYNDIAFTELPPSVLSNYTAMPINQFRGFEDAELRNEINATFFNHFNETKNIIDNRANVSEEITGEEYSDFTILDATNLPSLQFLSTSKAIPGNEYNEYLNNLKNLAASNDRLNMRINFTLSQSEQDTSALRNDRVHSNAVLDNYFAYDDGIAEGALEVNGNGSMILVEYTANVADSLRGVMFNFPHVNGDVQDQLFNLIVYVGELRDTTRTLTYTRKLLRPFYASNVYDTLQGFTTYMLTDPLDPVKPVAIPVPAGKFYVGWQQGTSTSTPIPVGFDKNNPSGIQKVFQNTGGNWSSLSRFSFLKGALMIRPIFGSETPLQTKAGDLKKVVQDLVVFPNPTNGLLRLETPDQRLALDWRVEIWNLLGQQVMNLPFAPQLDVHDLPEGTYLLRMTDQDGQLRATAKVVKF